MTSKIVTIKIVKASGKAGRWGGYKVRAITERGGIKSYEAYGFAEAKRTAASIQRENPSARIEV